MNCTPVAEPENMFNNEIRHFIDCIKLGQQPIATLEDGMAVQKILNGIYDSARLGREVKL